MAAGVRYRGPEREEQLVRIRNIVFATITLAVSVSLTLMLVEAGLRAVGRPFETRISAGKYRLVEFDSAIGWSYMPNTSPLAKLYPEKRLYRVHFDRFGARVPSKGAQSDTTLSSVIFVGGSITMGHGVTYNASFVGQLDSMPGFPFQAVNLGVEGQGTDQAYIQLQRYFPRFPVKAVVYSFLCDHIRRNAVHDRRFVQPKARLPGTKPKFVLKDGALHLAHRPQPTAEYPYSRLGAYLTLLRLRHGPPIKPGVTRAVVEAMRDYVEANGAVFLVVHWGQGRWTEQCDSTFFETMDVNLVNTERLVAPEWREWKTGDGHPDARAHRTVARLVLAKFRDLDVVRSPVAAP